MKWYLGFASACLLAVCVHGCDGGNPSVSAMDADSLMAPDSTGQPDIVQSGLCGDRACAPGYACCGGICTEIGSNPDNCGRCGRGCGDISVCESGQCVCGERVCGDNEACCDEIPGGLCLDVLSSTDNCGACGNSCAFNETCIGGACRCAGLDGSESCADSDACCPGLGCIDTQTDARNCGACGNSCGAGEVCVDGACSCGTEVGQNGRRACDSGERCCGSPAECHPEDSAPCQCGTSFCSAGQECCDATVNGQATQACIFLSADLDHCGACGAACGSAQSCSNGECECVVGFADCNGDPSDGCEVDLARDVDHCGGCGRICAPGEVCDGAGTCALSCQAGLEACNGRCVDLLVDRDNCGACDLTCTAGQLCDGTGLCGTSCQDSLTDCNGGCFNLLFNPDNCGACGQACAPGNVCDGEGGCALSCQEGLANCDGWCADLDSNQWHCGACGASCDPGQVCRGDGVCDIECLPGFVLCGGECVDPLTHSRHCGGCEGSGGSVCAPNVERCVQGACEPNCSAGLTLCAGACVDTESDDANCGTCATACGGSSFCVDGACQVVCATELTECGGACIHTESDPRHCGACDAACGAGEYCENGSCVAGIICPMDQMNCGGSCLDVVANSQHCGACNNDCGTGIPCVGGECQYCPAGTQRCGTVCVDLQSHPSHCGMCDNTCSAGAECTAGTCPTGASCLPGELSCAGSCVDPLTDPTDCGATACGNGSVCGAGQTCRGGACEDLVSPCTCTAPEECRAEKACVRENAGLVAVGADFACGIREDKGPGFQRQVVCWGANTVGQLGRPGPGPAPAYAGTLFDVVKVVAGNQFACAMDVAGAVYCWGDNSTGQLQTVCGTASCDSPQRMTDDGTPMGTPLTAIDITAGKDHVCVIVSGTPHDVLCWGNDDAGETGQSPGAHTVPNLVSNLSVDPNRIVAGHNHTCVWDSAMGQLECWGDNASGQLATNNGTPSTPIPVQTGVDAVRVGANGATTCALTTSGSFECWGDGSVGQFGDGCVGVACATTEVPVAGVEIATPVWEIAGGGDWFCSVRPVGVDGGTVECWGRGYGVSSDTMTLSAESTPIQVAIPGIEVSSISVNTDFGCAARISDPTEFYCWGQNQGLSVDPSVPATTVIPITAPRQVVTP